MASKVGADLESHPKIRHAWAMHHAALGLHLLGLSFAQRTSGFVSNSFVCEKVPAKRERTAVLSALMSVAPGEEHPMWSEVDGGWQIHNFARHTEFKSPEEEQALREARAAAGRKGAERTWQTDGKRDGNLPGKPMANGMANENGLPDFAIDDIEVVKKKDELLDRPELLSLCERLAKAICQRDPKAKVRPASARWLNATRLLLDQDGRTVQEVEAVIDWAMADSFWGSVVLSMPKLRAKFSELALKSRAPAVARENASSMLVAIRGRI